MTTANTSPDMDVRLLLVDDDAAIRAELGGYLLAHGFQ